MAIKVNTPDRANTTEKIKKPNPEASSDISKASTRENLSNVFGKPNEDK